MLFHVWFALAVSWATETPVGPPLAVFGPALPRVAVSALADEDRVQCSGSHGTDDQRAAFVSCAVDQASSGVSFGLLADARRAAEGAQSVATRAHLMFVVGACELKVRVDRGPQDAKSIQAVFSSFAAAARLGRIAMQVLDDEVWRAAMLKQMRHLEKLRVEFATKRLSGVAEQLRRDALVMAETDISGEKYHGYELDLASLLWWGQRHVFGSAWTETDRHAVSSYLRASADSGSKEAMGLLGEFHWTVTGDLEAARKSFVRALRACAEEPIIHTSHLKIKALYAEFVAACLRRSWLSPALPSPTAAYHDAVEAARALQDSTTESKLLVSLAGHLLEQAAPPQHAVAMLEQALSRDSANPSARFLLGVALFREVDSAESLAASQALLSEPATLPARYQRWRQEVLLELEAWQSASAGPSRCVDLIADSAKTLICLDRKSVV